MEGREREGSDEFGEREGGGSDLVLYKREHCSEKRKSIK